MASNSNSMLTVSRVLMSYDVDCDGSLLAAHLIRVPARMRNASTRDLARYAVHSEQLSGSHEICESMSWADFMGQTTLTKWEFEYFLLEGYARVSVHWNPWVYDDSIGIPALDSTYDEPMLNW